MKNDSEIISNKFINNQIIIDSAFAISKKIKNRKKPGCTLPTSVES
jgi:hypothetical protein